MTITLLPFLFLLALLAAVQAHLTGLCTSTGGDGVDPGVGRVWLLTYISGHGNSDISGNNGLMGITPSATGVTETVTLNKGCVTSGTPGSPAAKILGCPGVPNGALVTCYMMRGPGDNIAYTGDATKDATIYSTYDEKNAGLVAYADITFETGSYKITTTNEGLYFGDSSQYFRMSTESRRFEEFKISIPSGK
jgi:hypothetical protein